MTEINASIPLQVQQFQPVNAFNEGINARKNMMTANAFAQQQQDTQNLNSAYQQAGGDVNKIDKSGLTYAQGSQLTAEQSAADKARIEGEVKKLEIGGQLFSNVADQNSYTQSRNQYINLFPDAASKIPEQYNPQLVTAFNDHALTKTQQLQNEWMQKKYDQDQNQFNQTMDLNRQKLNLDVRKQNFDEQAPAGDVSGLSDQAIINAAARYNIDGTMPPLGIGKSAAPIRKAILEKAALLSAGIDPNDQRINQLGTKADAAALSQLAKQEAMVGSFEKTAQANGNLALQASNAIDRGSFQPLEKLVQMGETSFNDPKLAAFKTYTDNFVSEYAKVISGSMGNTPTSDAKIASAQQKLYTAQSKEAYDAVMKSIFADMDNRTQGFKNQKKALYENMKAPQSSQSPASTPATQPGPSANLPTTNNQGWVLHTDASGNKAYVSPDGKQYQEIQ